MEEADRQKIIRNLVELMRVRNVESFYTELIARNVFTPDMLDAIICERRSQREQIQKLFLETCKRGPDAFAHLVEALVRTGNVTQARLLDPMVRVDPNQRPNHHHHRQYDLVDHEEEENLNAVEAQAECCAARHHLQQDNTYQMNSRPTGFALIINVIDFDGNPNLKRVGADIDSRNLDRLLRNFGYEVDVVLNPKKKTLLCPETGVLKRFTDKFSVNPVDSCVVAIMSHGEDNFWIQTSDCENMSDDFAHLVHLWEEIFPRFNNLHFPMMRNKPKLFIVQSCRGEKIYRRIRVVPVSRSPSIQYDSVKAKEVRSEMYEHHPEFNHMMVLQSTLPGYVSIRDEERGSPFVQIFCQVVAKFGASTSLAEMIPEIAKRLQDLPPADGGPQTCTFKMVGYVKRFLFSKNISK